jgi:hypothetical protein
VTGEPINLMDRYGEKYRISWDPAYDAKGRHRDSLDPWSMQVPCERGVIYPWGGDRLAVEVDYRAQTARKVAAIPGVELAQDGDQEKTFAFHVDLFDQLAALVKPRKRRKCHLSPEQLRLGGERLRDLRPSPKAQGVFPGPVLEEAASGGGEPDPKG